MAKRKAKKQKPRMPKLSRLDQGIYWAILLVLAVLWTIVAAIPRLCFRSIAFADDTVIAANARWTQLWLMVPWMTFFLITFILWTVAYEGRRPLFGRKDVRYGPPHAPSIYPLFRRNNPKVWISEKTRKTRRTIALVLLLIFLMGFIPYPWSFFGRNCLHADGSVSRYSIFNSQREVCSSGDIKSVKFFTYRYSTGKYHRTRYWTVAVKLTAENGRVYSFDVWDFGDKQDPSVWLNAMAGLKRRFDPSILYYSGIDGLEKVIAARGLNEMEAALLYQIFDVQRDLP